VHDGGLEVPAGVSLLVGENGSGKSSLIEALAAADPRPVTSPLLVSAAPTQAGRTRPSRHRRARVHQMASPYGFFLWVEKMHGYFNYQSSRGASLCRDSGTRGKGDRPPVGTARPDAVLPRWSG
jgi:predicted ATPase